MPIYLIANRQPDRTPSPDAAAAWAEWFSQLGDHLVDTGNPAFSGTSIGECGPDTVLAGYTLITADDLDHAATLTASCPAITTGGGAEIGELTVLNQRPASES